MPNLLPVAGRPLDRRCPLARMGLLPRPRHRVRRRLRFRHSPGLLSDGPRSGQSPSRPVSLAPTGERSAALGEFRLVGRSAAPAGGRPVGKSWMRRRASTVPGRASIQRPSAARRPSGTIDFESMSSERRQKTLATGWRSWRRWSEGRRRGPPAVPTRPTSAPKIGSANADLRACRSPTRSGPYDENPWTSRLHPRMTADRNCRILGPPQF